MSVCVNQPHTLKGPEWYRVMLPSLWSSLWNGNILDSRELQGQRHERISKLYPICLQAQ